MIATANPIEYEGTYTLPEAQLDRFLLRVRMGYLTAPQETDMLRARIDRAAPEAVLRALSDPREVLAMRAAVERVEVDDDLLEYVVALVGATRAHPHIQVGASPRGGLALVQLARARAVLELRDYATPEDVKSVAVPALAHRVTLKPELWVRQIEADDVVARDRPVGGRAADPAAQRRPLMTGADSRRQSAAVERALGGRPDGTGALTEPPPPPPAGWRVGERALRRATVAGVALAAALLTGHAWLLALAAAPLVLLALAAAARAPPAGGRGRACDVESRRCFEGEQRHRPDRASATTAPSAGSTPRSRSAPACAWTTSPSAARTSNCACTAERWGRWTLGTVDIDLYDTGGLARRTVRVDLGEVAVFPLPTGTPAHPDPGPAAAAPRRAHLGAARRGRRGHRRPPVRPRRAAAAHPLARHHPARLDPAQPVRRRAHRRHRGAARRARPTSATPSAAPPRWTRPSAPRPAWSAPICAPTTGSASSPSAAPPAGCNPAAATRTSTGSWRACWRSARTSPTAPPASAGCRRPPCPSGALVYVFTPLTDQRILDVLAPGAGPGQPDGRGRDPHRRPARRSRTTAARNWRCGCGGPTATRCKFTLAERGIAVISHQPGETLDLALAPLLRTRIRGGLPMSRIDDRLVRLTARFLGTALAVAACDPAAAFHHSALATAMVVLVALVAWWAAPMVDERPVQTSVRWGALARRRRTTVLAAGSVVLAAWTQPPVWLAACVTVLLLAYLLATDTWTAGVTATPDVRVTGAPALAAAAACALVFLAVVRTAGAHLLGAAPRGARRGRHRDLPGAGPAAPRD